MKALVTTLMLFPLVWTVLTLMVTRFTKAGPGGSVLTLIGSVVVTTLVFGAPSTESILSAVLLWPALGAVIVVFLPRQWSDGLRRFASIWFWAGFVLSLYLLGPVVKLACIPEEMQARVLSGEITFHQGLGQASTLVQGLWRWGFEPFFGAFGDLTAEHGGGFTTAGYRFVEDVPWIASFGIHYKLGIDGISLWLILLTTLLSPIALDVSWNSIDTKVKEFAISFLLLQVGMLGAFIALDLFLFYVFWELMLVPMYLIIGVWGGKDRVYAAVKFFIYTMIGSLLMLVALLFLVHQHQEQTGLLTFDLERVSYLMLPRAQQMVLFIAFGVAFAIKVPMFPFHTWLPDAHVQAPTGGSVILAAVLLKLGGYGFLRFALPLFPWASRYIAPTLALIAVIGIVYGAYCAWVQRDIKKLVAYSSVSHLGFVMLGIFTMNAGGVSGAILQMVSHGISTGALFILVGVIYDRRHTRDLADFGGIAKVMPVYTAIFVIVTMSSVGLPGTNGFIGEFMILASVFTDPFMDATFSHHTKVFATVASTGVILAAIYMLHAVLKTFWGPIKNPENEKLTDLTGRERWILAPLVFLIFWIGLVPNFFLNPMRASVDSLTTTWEARAMAGFGNDERRILPGAPPIEDPAAPAEETPEVPPSDEGSEEQAALEAVHAALGDRPQAVQQPGAGQ